MLQESPIRPQSFDVRSGDSEWQAFQASASAPVTVTLEEEDESGAMAVDDAEEGEEEVGDEAMGSQNEEVASGDDNIGVASASPNASPV